MGPGEQRRAAVCEQNQESRPGSSSTAGSQAAPSATGLLPGRVSAPDSGGDTTRTVSHVDLGVRRRRSTTSTPIVGHQGRRLGG